MRLIRFLVDGRTEVWAAGVTYERSRTARMAESENSADIYDRVYAADRPELFFKSAAWRVSGPGAPVSVRADSTIDVPEPELAVVLNYAGDVVGYTDGVVLSTGTSLVPDLPFTLQAGDEIRVKISEIGELVNPVVRGNAAVAAAVRARVSA